MTGDFPLWMALSLFGFLRPGASSGEGKQDLLVELCDGTELDASILGAAQEEASRIFSTAAVEVRWKGNCDVPTPATGHSTRIYVVSRIPEAISERYYRNRGKTNIMGFALPNPEENRASVIYVGRQSVEAVARKSRRISLTETHLARAMGRVFAHELAHRFLGPGHTRKGILKDFLGQRDLIGEENAGLFFSPDQVRMLHLRIEGRSVGTSFQPGKGPTSIFQPAPVDGSGTARRFVSERSFARSSSWGSVWSGGFERSGTGVPVARRASLDLRGAESGLESRRSDLDSGGREGAEPLLNPPARAECDAFARRRWLAYSSNESGARRSTFKCSRVSEASGKGRQGPHGDDCT